MKITDDKQMNDVRGKLENLLAQLDVSKEEGEKTMVLHQHVIDIVKGKVSDMTEGKPDGIDNYLEAIANQIEKTKDQLTKIDARIEAGKKIVEKLEDEDFRFLATAMLIFIGAEQPTTEEKTVA